MVKEGKLWGICLDVYRQEFKEATPSADFDELIKTGETKIEKFFMKYYLPQKRQNQIVQEHCEKNNLSRHEKEMVEGEVSLGCSPTGIKKSCFDCGWEKCAIHKMHLEKEVMKDKTEIDCESWSPKNGR